MKNFPLFNLFGFNNDVPSSPSQLFDRFSPKYVGGLTDVQFRDAYKQGRRDFCQTTLDGVDLQGIQLRELQLRYSDLRFARNLNLADLTGADLMGVDLSGTHLSGFNFSSAVLCDANLRGANLAENELTELPSGILDALNALWYFSSEM